MMGNQKLMQLLSFGFISFCFCFGLGIGIFIRFGQLQPSNAATTAEPEMLPFIIPLPTTSPDDSVFTLRP
ncbi:capsule biosynthesis protein [Nostoc sp. LEGE 06077]|uniref:capsule biosynthesis protein n=1 Tax=Nostoc sp. LEGE 06077 TaxID=915325 RepID=UPI001D15345D|nr:capsule biosynthesis protein [Nostoc sp. LEGE 06077]